MIARIARVSVLSIGFSFAGPYIRRKQAASPISELFISLAGPLASFGLAAFFGIFAGKTYNWLAEMNLLIAFSNLIPLFKTDGDRAVDSLCLAMRP